MRILLIDVNCKNSSTGKIVYSLYSYIRARGNDVAVCYGRGDKIIEDGIYKFGIDIETYIHALMTRLTGYTGYFSPFSTRRLIRYIKRFQPDVVHIHELHAYFVNIKPLLRYLSKNHIPVVWTFHCEFMYTGKCGYALSCDNWKKGCGNCTDLKRYPTVLFFDKTRKMFEDKKDAVNALDKLVITVPSPWLHDRVKDSCFSNRDIRTVYNGIDTQDIFVPYNKLDAKKQLNLDGGKSIVLAVAQNIVARAGERIREIALKMPDVNFYLIGDGQKSEDYPDNVHMVGRITDQKLLAHYYSAADIFLLCSKKETFSMPCAEALCCGTQVVGYEAGAPESAFEKPFAEFIEYGNADALVKLITRRIEHPIQPKDCAIYGNSAFSEEAMCQAFVKIYDEVCYK